MAPTRQHRAPRAGLLSCNFPKSRSSHASKAWELKAFVEDAYSPFGVTVVDTQAVFQTDDFTDMVTLPGFGSVPVNVASICAHTYVCSPFADVHANPAGNAVIAHAVELAVGL